ncbi:MAG: polyprenyl synthetase family protein [Desulfitobacteriia bacterium]|jgi:geranylgeranyl diphosphate synthase type II
MFKRQYNYYTQLIEKYLNSLSFGESPLGQSMKYSLQAGGKRIRPVLALACAELVGGEPEKFVEQAAALELIHTYSLIHDDLPAMDDDDFRRGKPSNHKVFGEAVAILAGDALLTYAFEILSRPKINSRIPAEKRLEIIHELARASGWQGMVGGQILDILGDQKELPDLENMHAKKTGALIIASARIGAILGGGTAEDLDNLTAYASFLGLAFQIKDDILDVTSEKEIIGKPIGSDERLGKTTYTSVLGVNEAVRHLQNMIFSAQEYLKNYGARAKFLSSLADYVAERDQ